MLFARRSINAILSEVGCRKESGINSNSLISSPAESTNDLITYQQEKRTKVVQTIGYISTFNSVKIFLLTDCYFLNACPSTAIAEYLCLVRWLLAVPPGSEGSCGSDPGAPPACSAACNCGHSNCT